MTKYTKEVTDRLNFILEKSALGIGPRKQGKVRDIYDAGSQLLIVTTDRVSAFDRNLASIPCKGQVLNQVSVWWFEQTKDIIPNHLVNVIDENAIMCKKCKVFAIEFVVRGYITGTTSTSMWTNYKNGVRDYCGIKLPEGLKHNQKLEQNIVTPTTKEEHHDRLISPKEIVSEGLMTQEEWNYCSEKVLQLFARGQEEALKRGLLLVDTKYELGRDENGVINLVDEIHTPDSSRYWIASTYTEKFGKGEDPDRIDKDVLRVWYSKNTDPYKDAELPPPPENLVVLLAQRYIELYERITGTEFQFPKTEIPYSNRIESNLFRFSHLFSNLVIKKVITIVGEPVRELNQYQDLLNKSGISSEEIFTRVQGNEKILAKISKCETEKKHYKLVIVVFSDDATFGYTIAQASTFPTIQQTSIPIVPRSDISSPLLFASTPLGCAISVKQILQLF